MGWLCLDCERWCGLNSVLLVSDNSRPRCSHWSGACNARSDKLAEGNMGHGGGLWDCRVNVGLEQPIANWAKLRRTAWRSWVEG